jgi:hypothetical protein
MGIGDPKQGVVNLLMKQRKIVLEMREGTQRTPGTRSQSKVEEFINLVYS